jgi:DNA-directed RNA polymerase specialized sigma subunit
MDSWEELHLPVLRAVVERYDETGQAVRFEEIAERSDLSSDEVRRAFRALEHEQPPFFAETSGTAEHGVLIVTSPTGHARRTVGQWPTAESLADKIVASLREAAEQEEDPEKAGWLKRSASWFSGAGRDVLVSVASSAVTRGVGM